MIASRTFSETIDSIYAMGRSLARILRKCMLEIRIDFWNWINIFRTRSPRMGRRIKVCRLRCDREAPED